MLYYKTFQLARAQGRDKNRGACFGTSLERLRPPLHVSTRSIPKGNAPLFAQIGKDKHGAVYHWIGEGATPLHAWHDFKTPEGKLLTTLLHCWPDGFFRAKHHGVWHEYDPSE